MKILISQLLGLILYLFLMFVVISYSSLNKEVSNLKNILKDKNIESNTKACFANNKKFITLKRVSKLLIFLLILFNFQLINFSFDLSKMDGLLKFTDSKLFFLNFILIISAVIINNQDSQSKTENLIIIKTNLLGITIMILSNDWILTIVSWELFNMSLYLLVSLKSERESSLAASLKYFVLSALSTTLLLIGVCKLYKLTGSTHYEIIETNLLHLIHNDINVLYIDMAFILIFFTLLFKLSAAPLHQWAPDLYESLETKITNWKMIIPKLSVLTFILVLIDNFSLILINEKLLFLFLISGSLSIFIGSIALYNQWLIKRFLAYSSISHIGFMLLALYCKDLQSFIFYMLIYGLTTLNIFTIFKVISDINLLNSKSSFNHKVSNNSFQFNSFDNIYDIKNIQELAGLIRLNPFLSIAFSVTLFSLAGS